MQNDERLLVLAVRLRGGRGAFVHGFAGVAAATRNGGERNIRTGVLARPTIRKEAGKKREEKGL
jgi:hypothetical protein